MYTIFGYREGSMSIGALRKDPRGSSSRNLFRFRETDERNEFAFQRVNGK